MRIWKYELDITDVQYLSIPSDVVFLSVQVQNGVPCMWAMVDENAPKEEYRVRIIGTGNPMPINPGEFVGTFQVHGVLVFHAFVEPA